MRVAIYARFGNPEQVEVRHQAEVLTGQPVMEAVSLGVRRKDLRAKLCVMDQKQQTSGKK